MYRNSQFQKPEGEIGRQHIESASGCRLSPYMITPHPPRTMTALSTTPGTIRPLLK